jgi:hypothetical protein
VREWVEKLGCRFQGVLLSAIRGCDGIPKGPARKITQAYRGVILCSENENPSSFITFPSDRELREVMVEFLGDIDHLPVHFLTHLAYAAEIIGYKHPAEAVRRRWRWFYRAIVHSLHFNEETEHQLDERLGASEEVFARNQEISNG